MSSASNGFDERTLDRIIDCLEQRFGLDALWLFGSQAEDRATVSSDIDVAVLLSRRPALEEWIETLGELDRLEGRCIDLVDLDGASPILAMQVLKHGRLLVDLVPSRRIAFVGKTLSMYEDLKIFRRPIEEALIARYRDG